MKAVLMYALGTVAVFIIGGCLIYNFVRVVDCVNTGGTPVRGVFRIECMR